MTNRQGRRQIRPRVLKGSRPTHSARTASAGKMRVSCYRGRYAELYDVFYGDKPYIQEAEVVHQLFQTHRAGPVSRILEVACGTGSHALALESLGYTIIATDDSEDMLSVARGKAVRAGSRVEFRRQDMRAIDLPDPPFDAVLCLFDSVGYVLTNQALLETLRGVHRYLKPGGLFVFDFWHAAAMLRNYEPVRVRRWSMPYGEVVRISETRLECQTQIAHVTYTTYELRHDGTFSRASETHANRFFLVQEMAGWLTACGLSPVEWHAGFSDKEITEDTWHVLAVARRQEGHSG